MQNSEINKNIEEFEGPNAIFPPKAHTAASVERSQALRQLLKRDKYCSHFDTSKEAISGIGKYLSKLSKTPNGYAIADSKFRNEFENNDIYNPCLLHSLSMLIAAIIVKENMQKDKDKKSK